MQRKTRKKHRERADAISQQQKAEKIWTKYKNCGKNEREIKQRGIHREREDAISQQQKAEILTKYKNCRHKRKITKYGKKNEKQLQNMR